MPYHDLFSVRTGYVCVCIRYSHPELCVVAFASTVASKTWSLELGMAKGLYDSGYLLL